MPEDQRASIFDVTQSAFEREVIERSHEVPVVVDFWAPWCAPCRMLGPLLEKLAKERAGNFVLAKVNIDEAPELALRYGVEAIPAIKAFRNGKSILGFVGVLPEAALREFIDRICPSELDYLAQKGANLEKERPDEAEKVYREVLSKQRDHLAAAVGLSRLLIARNEDTEAGGLLERVAPGGDLSDEVERLSAILSLREFGRAYGDESSARRRLETDPGNASLLLGLGYAVAAAGRYEEALQLMLAAAEKDRKLATAAVKEAMVKIFHIIGVRSPLADEYRDKLSRLLY
jgi:putative thioredoxin